MKRVERWQSLRLCETPGSIPTLRWPQRSIKLLQSVLSCWPYSDNDDDTSKIHSTGRGSHAKTTPIRRTEVLYPPFPQGAQTAESQIVDIVRVVIHPIVLSHLLESYLATRFASSFWIPIKIIQHHLEHSCFGEKREREKSSGSRRPALIYSMKKSTEEIDQKI